MSDYVWTNTPYIIGDEFDAAIFENPYDFVKIFLSAVEDCIKLHKRNMLQGDVKSDNVKTNKIENEYITRMIDFGYANEPNGDIIESKNMPQQMYERFFSHNAPELIGDGLKITPTLMLDYYGMADLLNRVFEMLEAVSKNKVLNRMINESKQELKPILQKGLSKNPADREDFLEKMKGACIELIKKNPHLQQTIDILKKQEIYNDYDKLLNNPNLQKAIVALNQQNIEINDKYYKLLNNPNLQKAIVELNQQNIEINQGIFVKLADDVRFLSAINILNDKKVNFKDQLDNIVDNQSKMVDVILRLINTHQINFGNQFDEICKSTDLQKVILAFKENNIPLSKDNWQKLSQNCQSGDELSAKLNIFLGLNKALAVANNESDAKVIQALIDNLQTSQRDTKDILYDAGKSLYLMSKASSQPTIYTEAEEFLNQAWNNLGIEQNNWQQKLAEYAQEMVSCYNDPSKLYPLYSKISEDTADVYQGVPKSSCNIL